MRMDVCGAVSRDARTLMVMIESLRQIACLTNVDRLKSTRAHLPAENVVAGFLIEDRSDWMYPVFVLCSRGPLPQDCLGCCSSHK